MTGLNETQSGFPLPWVKKVTAEENMLDWRKLLATEIPVIHQHVTPRDAVFYALSVGLGQDPLDERQLDYVDAHKKLRVVPSMAIVLANPGFWYAKVSDTGLDPKMLVHGEQSFTMHAKLPIEGALSGRFKITGIVDKGPGKGAMMYNDKELFDAAGNLLAVASGTTFIRGAGGFGGPDSPVKPVHASPDTPPDILCDLPTRPEQALYYRLNGDLNPLHADPEVARSVGFPRPILHGLCTLGVVTHALLRSLAAYDETRLTSLALRFSAPVYPGETIRTEIWRDGSFQARVLERDVVVVSNGKAVIG
jgi:acyl dehydratase